MGSKSLLQNWSMHAPSSVIIPYVSPEKKLNLPLPPKIILLKVGLMNRFGFKTLPCKSQLRYCYS